jgi:hypothetical protein
MNIESTIYGKFGVWKGRNLSVGGRITLINSVLPNFPFSFFKAPIGVIKELVNIQRRLLWGGGSDSKKMCWVSWNRICQPKDRSGLGVKNLELFNNSLAFMQGEVERLVRLFSSLEEFIIVSLWFFGG